MIARLTRRSFLSTASSLVASSSLWAQATGSKTQHARQLPRVGEFVRFLDAVTETPVVRLTALSSADYLPARENRAVSVKGRFLVFSSDRSGLLCPFRLDLRTGQITQLSTTQALDSSSLSLDAAARTVWFLDGRSLQAVTLANKRMQTVAENVSQFNLGSSPGDLSFVRDGRLYFGSEQRVLAQDVIRGLVRPGGAGCLFSRANPAGGEELWYISLSPGAKSRQLAAGPAAAPCWSADGRSVFFLRNRTICEVVPETGVEQRLGGVSQFVAFSPNADSSVFVGASGSKAQPTINLLLRNPPREFTLCEHRASEPEKCAPVFSGDSRRVYFNSDFQGKPAIYSVNVEALIEETSG